VTSNKINVELKIIHYVPDIITLLTGFTMAVYQDSSFLIRSDHFDFNVRRAPGTSASVSGIYRCVGCGQEIVAKKGQLLPEYEEHIHGFELGPPRWQLIVFIL